MKRTSIYRLILTSGIVIAALLICISGVFPGVRSSIAEDGDPPGQLLTDDFPAKGNPKLDSALNRLVSEITAKTDPGLLPFNFAQETEGPEETVRVIIEGVHGQAGEIASAAGASGDVEASYGDLVQAVIPVSRLTDLAGMASVQKVRVPTIPLPAATTSEGVVISNADDWLSASYNGSGVKIGVLDVGFYAYATRQAEGELPTVSTWWAPSIGNEGTVPDIHVHGTACAEIVYDMAPAATYYLANFSTVVEYGNAVEWLVDQGVDVISCSVGWPTGGLGDGTGTVCQIIDYARANGVFWAQSAGNQAQMHWQGEFTDIDANKFHEFAVGDEANARTGFEGYIIQAWLKWDDIWGASANDYDLLLFDSTDTPVWGSDNPQDGDDDPYEYFYYTATYTGEYRLRIYNWDAEEAVNFHLYTNNYPLEYQTASSSFTVPADSFGAVAVGAVDYSSPGTLEYFSSRGPTDDGRTKPDLVATDNVSTVSYSSGFTGTSAAAPHVAGAAALVKERFPTYTPIQIQSFLEGRAIDLGSAGKDNLYGSGRLYLGTASANFTLTTAASGSGNVTPAAGTHSYAEGTVVSVNATPEAGWQFTGWTGDVADADLATTNVTLDDDKMVTANFNQFTANLTMMTNGSGNVTPVAGTYSYTLNDKENITATPSTNWEFVSWTGDVSDNTSASTNVTMDTNKTVIANFNRVNSVLKMTISGSGSITPAAGYHTYAVGSTVNITATPASGWQFSSWSGDVANASSASTNITMNWDKTVTAVFTQIPPPPIIGGGGGVGGGGAVGDKRITNISSVTNNNHILDADVEALSVDNMATVLVAKGTEATNRAGSTLSSIIIENIPEPPAAPANTEIIGEVYDLGPRGAHFNPPVLLTLEYDEESLPEEVSENGLYMATWNEEIELWERKECDIDPENNFIGTRIEHFSKYAILAETIPAEINISSLSVTPAEIYPDDNATVSITVTNVGTLAGSCNATLRVNGQVHEMREITVAGGDNVTAIFAVTGSDIGAQYIEIGGLAVLLNVVPPAGTITISDLTVSPGEAAIGEEVNISVLVTNTSGSLAGYEVKLNISGTIMDTRKVLLAGRSSQEVIFTTMFDTAGKRIIDINGLIGGLIITGEVPPPSQVPLPSLENGAGPAREPVEEIITPEPVPDLTQEPASSPENSRPLIILIAAGCFIAVLLLLYFTWWRRRGKVNSP